MGKELVGTRAFQTLICFWFFNSSFQEKAAHHFRMDKKMEQIMEIV